MAVAAERAILRGSQRPTSRSVALFINSDENPNLPPCDASGRRQTHLLFIAVGRLVPGLDSPSPRNSLAK